MIEPANTAMSKISTALEKLRKNDDDIAVIHLSEIEAVNIEQAMMAIGDLQKHMGPMVDQLPPDEVVFTAIAEI